MFKSSLNMFFPGVGRSLAENEGLDALIERQAGAAVWNGPYIQQSAIYADPNGYAVPSTTALSLVASSGADGQTGGTDADADITRE